MTPQDLITQARYIVNDSVATYRVSDSEMLAYFNDSLREISSLQPSVYETIGDLTCAVGTCEQAVTFSSAQAVVNVLCIHDGAALTPFSIPSMDAFNPGWRSDTVGAAKQWAKYPGQPLRFFIYPKAPATAQVLDILYVRNATAHSINDNITEVPSSFFPAIVDYIVYRTESKDDEHATSGKAIAGYQSFVAKVKGV